MNKPKWFRLREVMGEDMILGLAYIVGGLDYFLNFQSVWAIMPYHINDATQTTP